jgi:hypothetical protein
MEWAGVLGDARSLGCARDDRFCWIDSRGRVPNVIIVGIGTRTGVSALHDPSIRPHPISRSKCCALVEILVSHLSAKDAERWGTLHFW